jgi:hypothetical protein
MEMTPMNPLCPHCLKDMSRAASSRNLFHCEPCREIVQFFGVGLERGDGPREFWLSVRRKRDVNYAAFA